MILQATHRFPIPDDPGAYEGMVDNIKAGVKARFALELIDALTEKGGIVGPIHEEETRQKDWLWQSGTTLVTYTVYAQFTDMPKPEHYRLMGGPADGRIVMTGGARDWQVPVLEYPKAALFDVNEDVPIHYAQYEREGDTAIYLFRSMQ